MGWCFHQTEGFVNQSIMPYSFSSYYEEKKDFSNSYFILNIYGGLLDPMAPEPQILKLRFDDNLPLRP